MVPEPKSTWLLAAFEPARALGKKMVTWPIYCGCPEWLEECMKWGEMDGADKSDDWLGRNERVRHSRAHTWTVRREDLENPMPHGYWAVGPAWRVCRGSGNSIDSAQCSGNYP